MKHVRYQSNQCVAGGPLHNDARQHRTGRAGPWFVVAAVALLAAIVAG
jgi:hypothetical protein